MSEVTVYDLNGDKKGAFNIETEAFTSGVSISLLHRAVVSYEANLRQGSANTKTRGERAGSGKKLWKQKGTGRARMGSIRSPLWRGGGVTFGPKPRDFSMKLSQKEKNVALRGALAGKLIDNEISALESLSLSEVKTKVIANFIKKAGFEKRVLFVTETYNAEFLRAARNIPNVTVAPANELNALTVLKSTDLVFEKSALEKMITVEAAK
jgi:large subunit ribosomal protein L4